MLLVYRDSVRAAVAVTASTVRCVARLEREGRRVLAPDGVLSVPVVQQLVSVRSVPFDWQLLYARLLSSLCYV